MYDLKDLRSFLRFIILKSTIPNVLNSSFSKVPEMTITFIQNTIDRQQSSCDFSC